MHAKSDEGMFWFRFPEDETLFMTLRPAELKCYLVVVRAIQRDRNGGKISERQIAARACVAPRHAHDALARLVELGRLRRDGTPGSVTTYALPFAWNGPNCIPTGERSKQVEQSDRTPTGKQLDRRQQGVCAPVGIQHCTPRGEQHLESSENTHTRGARAKGLHPDWPMGGWESAEDFETWWRRLVQQHPNKGRNALAMSKAVELVFLGVLKRSDFETGYQTLAERNRERWAAENGRYAPNLWTLLEDRAWTFERAGPSHPPASAQYQDAAEYLRRIQGE